jgi:hypothetical protein
MGRYARQSVVPAHQGAPGQRRSREAEIAMRQPTGMLPLDMAPCGLLDMRVDVPGGRRLGQRQNEGEPKQPSPDRVR